MLWTTEEVLSARLMLFFCLVTSCPSFSSYVFRGWVKYLAWSRDSVGPHKSSCKWPFGGVSCSGDIHQWSLCPVTVFWSSCSGNMPDLSIVTLGTCQKPCCVSTLFSTCQSSDPGLIRPPGSGQLRIWDACGKIKKLKNYFWQIFS